MHRLFAALAVMVALVVSPVGASAAGDGGKDGKDDGKKVTICHIPPGNPANAHTITVSVNAVRAHLAHGDTVGPCRKKDDGKKDDGKDG